MLRADSALLTVTSVGFLAFFLSYSGSISQVNMGWGCRMGRLKSDAWNRKWKYFNLGYSAHFLRTPVALKVSVKVSNNIVIYEFYFATTVRRLTATANWWFKRCFNFATPQHSSLNSALIWLKCKRDRRTGWCNFVKLYVWIFSLKTSPSSQWSLKVLLW